MVLGFEFGLALARQALYHLSLASSLGIAFLENLLGFSLLIFELYSQDTFFSIDTL
jgi:hypothetical protein